MTSNASSNDNTPTTQPGQCESCLPDATVWATSTPEAGPKSYFITVKDGKTQLFFELKYNAEDKGLIAEPYRPADYDYTIHDGCDHVGGHCIEDTPEFYEQMQIDNKAVEAGYTGLAIERGDMRGTL